MRLRLLAIIWIMMSIAVGAVDLVERNRRSVGSLFDDKPKQEDFDLFGNWKNAAASTTESSSRGTIVCTPSSKIHKRSAKKSLENLSSRDALQEPDESIEPESLKPHVRVKRNGSFRRSIGNSPSYVHRIPRRTYETFSSEEMNAADESEAEYETSLDDDIDVPGTFLDDQMTMKRNSLEDVYPEVKNHRVERDHSPPEFLKPDAESHSTPRLKREKERDADCEYEEGEDYYDEDEEETSNQKNREPASEAIASKDARSINTVKQSVKQPQSNQEDAQASENNENQNVIQVDRLDSRNKEAYVNGKPAAKKKPNNGKHQSVKPQAKKVAPKKPNKTSPPKAHQPNKKTKAMPSKSKHNHKNPKSSIASLVENQSNQLKAKKNYNDQCCSESTAKNKNKMIKTIVIKAVPKSASSQELQIKVGESKPADRSNVIKAKAEMSMGEMRDLLTRLMIKVDNLHSLVSEMRNSRVDRLEGNPADQHINCMAKAHRRAADGL